VSRVRSEIFEQPSVLERLLVTGREPVLRAADAIREFAPEWVTIAARGSSDNAARYAQYLLGARHRLSVALALPSLVTLYGASPRVGRALVIGVSQSGQSPDVVSVLSDAANQGALTLALTNDDTSPLSRAARHTLPLSAGTEHSVAATKTYTAELCLFAMLSAALSSDAHDAELVASVPDLVRDTLALNPDLDDAAQNLDFGNHAVVLGRGYNYATAFELALKLKELAYVLAEPYSTADFLHGPVALVDKGFPVILVAPSGVEHPRLAELFELFEERGAHAIVLSDQAALLERAALALTLPSDIPEWLSPITSVVAGQRLAVAVSLARGHDPNRPRGLAKVTLTR
jgi:glucosamine--fructose-6-phosphate aminotransferase (isomerizing)